MSSFGDSATRAQSLISEFQKTCRESCRSTQVKLVAVSKTMSVERIQEVYDVGIRCFGENKIQEYLDKKDRLPEDIEWHFIGRLQTNKVKALVTAACRHQLALFQSLDRIEIAQEIEKQAAKAGLKHLACLIQVNSSGEDTKAGFQPQAIEGFLNELKADSVIDVKGLMTIGPHTDDENRIRLCFQSIRKLRDELKVKFPKKNWETLSMGMSADYKLALAEGSTLVRVGTAIFGTR